MNMASHAPASVDEALAAVRAQGLRASSARRLVLANLFEAGGRPVTAEQIADGLGGRLPCSDLASVYRNLETLERIGIVRHLHAAHGPGLYVLKRSAEEGFVACERCGEVRAADPRALTLIRTAISRAFGYQASFVHFPIVGVCRDCGGDA